MIQGPDAETRFALSDGWPIGDATTYMLDMGTKVAPYTLVLPISLEFMILIFLLLLPENSVMSLIIIRSIIQMLPPNLYLMRGILRC